MQCPHCDTTWPDALKDVLKFCGACGKPMDADAPLPAPAPAVREPGGELRYMTVVFADLAGFTAFAEDRAPDEVARIVGNLLQRLGAAVEQHNGAVDKFLGDAVVATFGLPHPDPSAARNAVRAGLEMQAAAVHFNAEHGFNFGLRVGIHAGEAMFRAIGGSWTVMGDTVNTASRIQSAATPGKVWISQPVYEEVRRYFHLDVRPAVELKGKKHVVQPYEVLAERATPLLELPPFVGREQEWTIIQKQLNAAFEQETLRLLVLSGETGVGKSRLVWELREWAQRAEQLIRLDIIQYDHSERLPSHGLNALIRSRFELPLELSEAETLAALQARLPQVYPDVPAGHAPLAVEFFAFVLGILRPEFQIASMDGEAKWNNAFLEIKAWLESEARKEPWIIVLEDVQKGDADTAVFFDWALKTTWRAPIFVLLTARDEDFAPQCYWYSPLQRWVAGERVPELRLREIPPATLAPALTALGEGRISPALALRIAEHTEGNPLFATELALLMHDTHIENDTMPLPGSVREVMEARLERLGVNGKEVAKRGALMGRRFTLEAVARIWERPAEELQAGVQVLEDTETVYEEVSRLFAGEMEKVFRHGRLQEAALARIPREERLRWLAGLEAWAKTKLENFGAQWEGAGLVLIPVIARARREHEDAPAASLWYETLAWLYRKNHRLAEAAAAFRDALAGASGARRPVLQRLIAELEIISGALEPACDTVTAGLDAPADTLADTLADTRPDLPPMPERLAGLVDDALARWDRLTLTEAHLTLELARAEINSKLGELQLAAEQFAAVRAALAPLHGLIADILRIRWADHQGYFLTEQRGEPQAAQGIFDELRQQVDLARPELQAERARIAGTEFNIEMRLGRFDRAQALSEELLALARAEKNLRKEARAWNQMGITLTALGRCSAGADAYTRALTLAGVIGERRLEAIATHNLALTRMDQLRLSEARELQQAYLIASRAIGNHMAEAYAPASLAAIAMTAGEFAAAETLIAQARAIAEKNSWQRMVGWAQALQANLGFYRWLAGERGAPSCAALREALAGFAAAEEGWQTLDETGEYYAAWALAALGADGPAAAQAILDRAYTVVDASWSAAHIFLELAQTLVNAQPVEEIAARFRASGWERGAWLAERVAERIE